MKHNWIPDYRPARAWLCLLLALLLAGCAATSALPRQYSGPPQVQSWKLSLVTASGQTEDSLLVIQPEARNATRWIQTNPLGAPLARLSLHDGRWATDGFLPPNPRARQLFEAIIAAQMPRAQWPAAYPDTVVTTAKEGDHATYTFSRQGRLLWSIRLPATTTTNPGTSQQPATHIVLPDRSQWQLTPIQTRT